jgi:hypothetical protein
MRQSATFVAIVAASVDVSVSVLPYLGHMTVGTGMMLALGEAWRWATAGILYVLRP